MSLKFPIIKRERFDEDNMKHLLNDERFAKNDRIKLSQYNKHRVSGSSVNVSYKLGLGCEEFQLGRLFPDDGIGMQNFRFDLRNPLSEKYSWDVDIENCHYVIAQQKCEEYGISHNFINKYIEHREECLKMVSNSRKKSKTEFLKVLYGGDIKLYTEQFQEVDGNISLEGFQFLKEIEKEVNILMTILWDKYPQYHKLKTGKEKIMICKKPNPKASLMSLLFQTQEREILLKIDEFLTLKGRNMTVYIHDGGYIDKLEKETEFPPDLLKLLNYYLCDLFNINIKVTQKPIVYDWKPYKPQETQYEIMKREFEENNFIIGSTFCCIHKDNYIEYMKYGDAKTKFSNKIVNVFDDETQKNKKRKFLDMWMEDPKRKEYERIDFIPNTKDCPDTIYNLFKGFKAEKYKMELTKEESDEAMKPIIEHFDIITSGYADWIFKWFANIIQTPHIKSENAILIRDMGGLLIEGGGTGKNLAFEYFGNEIIGEDYCHVIGDNKELYTQFNSLLEGKLLVFVEEAGGKDNFENTDFLKSKITSKKINVNKKMVAQYKANDYSRYIFTSNNKNPLPIRQGDRRFSVFDANPIKRGNDKYFKKLADHLAKDSTKWAFYQYLKTYKTYDNPIEFQKYIPITQAYQDIRFLNAPSYHKWLVHCVKTKTLKDDYTSNLFDEFIKWLETNKEHTRREPISKFQFGSLLINSKESQGDYQMDTICGERTNSGKDRLSYMKWNIKGVIKGLQNLHLLPPIFESLNEIVDKDFDEDSNESFENAEVPF
jgi:hypothetical protein